MKQQGYLSYLLRLWETSDGEKVVWRASVERPGTGERQSFADVQTLFEFLQREITMQEKKESRIMNHERSN